MKGRLRVVAAVAVLCLSSSPASARRPKGEGSHKEHLDQREVQGRALFARGDYQGALDLYVTLFAEKGDPIYLRNIGRCYQKLEKPDKAINSFDEYLRRGHVKPSERSEVEGFIQEMEQLRKRQQAAAATQPPADSAPPAAHSLDSPPPAPVTAEPAAPATGNATEAPGAVLTQQAQTEPAADSGSITGRWWFWTAVAAVVVGGAVGVYVATRPQGGGGPPCTPSATMFCSSP
jgi:tetratricopeptide (TPR) repeat protein